MMPRHWIAEEIMLTCPGGSRDYWTRELVREWDQAAEALKIACGLIPPPKAAGSRRPRKSSKRTRPAPKVSAPDPNMPLPMFPA